jgi:peptidoglycan hydrolase CwlO-like protein
MTEIVSFSDLARFKAELADRDAKIAALTAELDETKTKLNTVRGVNDLLKIKIRDLEKIIKVWQSDLTETVSTLKTFYGTLPPDF